MPSKVFISYRRNDVPQVAKQMYEELVRHFPKEDVFMDVDSIQYGSNFLASIEQHIILADSVLVLIGPRYNGLPGERRLMQTNDFVRLELELAFRHQKRVLPILIGPQTQIPSQTDLPPSLFHLPFINAVCLPTSTLTKQDLNQIQHFISSGSQSLTPASLSSNRSPKASPEESLPISSTTAASSLTMLQQSKATNLRAKQRQQRFQRFQNQRQLRLTANLDGIISLVVILLIIGVAFLRDWNISWWYFISILLSYILFLLFFSRVKHALHSDRLLAGDYRYKTVIIYFFKIRQSNIPQILIAAHFALLLLVVGLWLNPANFFTQVGIFAGAVLIGGGLPFLVLRFNDPESPQARNLPPVLAHLVVVDSGPSKIAPGTAFSLNPKTTIGRGPTNTIQISESFLSAEHTRLWFRNGAWYVQDAGSTNGTFLNNTSARDVLQAYEGDIIQVGFIRFKLVR